MHPNLLKYPQRISSIATLGLVSATTALNFRYLERLVKPRLLYQVRRGDQRHVSEETARRFILAVFLLASVCLTSTSCSKISTNNPGQSMPAGDDGQIISAQQSHSIKMEVTGKAVVKRLLSDDTKPPRHQKFIVELSNGTTILVAHNIDEAERVPVEPGTTVIVHGEYIWKEEGGVLHWTHHSNSPRHEGGWIECAGRRYE